MSGSSISYAKTSLNNFIDCMSDNDKGCLVSFESNAQLRAGLGSSKDVLHTAVNSLTAGGGTRVSTGLTMGINQLLNSSSGNDKAVVLICDGDVDNVQSSVDTAVANNIKIYTINVLNSSQSTLQSIADQTGGEYYHAYSAAELLDAFSHIGSESLFDFSLTDSDGDGLPDTFETNGMRCSNGKIIYTDPNNADTDGDGVSDGDEMGTLRKCNSVTLNNFDFPTLALPDIGMYFGNGLFSKNVLMFDIKSDPNAKDSDGDGLDDLIDSVPLNALTHNFLIYKTLHDDLDLEYMSQFDNHIDDKNLYDTYPDFTYGDESFLDLLGKPPITIADFPDNEYQHVSSFLSLFAIGSIGDEEMAQVAKQMSLKFVNANNEDNHVFCNDTLNERIKNHPNTASYVNIVTNIINNGI